jgi:hypothetical protein
VRLGVVARMEAGRGLANQTWEVCRHLDPERVLLVDPGRDGRFTQHPERFTQWETTTVRWNAGRLDEQAVRKWLDGLSVVYSAETPYDLRLPQWAAEAGCGVVVQANPEFLSPTDAKAAVTWWVATPWRLEHLPARTRVVPMPVPEPPFTHPGARVAGERSAAGERTTVSDGTGPAGDGSSRVAARTDFLGAKVPNQRQFRHAVNTALAEATRRKAQPRPLRFLHTAGWPAVADRNGTGVFAEAAGMTTVDADFVIRGQHPDVTRYQRRGLRVEQRCTADYWDNYRDADILVLPRRFGGLSLPCLEAMAVGLPVVMSDCSPNEVWPGPRVPASSTATVGTRAGPLPLFDTDPRALAATMDELAANPEMVDKLRAEATEWAAANSWDALKSMWLEELARACW